MRNFTRRFQMFFSQWSIKYHEGLILFNLILMMLFLLHSVGYFYPFFPITINIIILVGLILSVFLIGARSKAIFTISLLFWVFTLIFKAFGIEVWADRSGIYVYESLFIGVIVLLLEKLYGDW